MNEKKLIQGLVLALNEGHNFKIAVLADETGEALRLSNRDLGLIAEALRAYKKECNEAAARIEKLKNPRPDQVKSLKARSADADSLGATIRQTFELWELD